MVLGSVDILLLLTLSSTKVPWEAKLMKTGWFPINQDSIDTLSNIVYARGTDFPPLPGHS